jgi:hypothetical protein
MTLLTYIKIIFCILFFSLLIYFYLKASTTKKKLLKIQKVLKKWHKKWLFKNRTFNMQRQKLNEDYNALQNRKIEIKQQLQQAKLIEAKAEKMDKVAQQKIVALENQVARLTVQLEGARQNVKRRKQQLNELKE